MTNQRMNSFGLDNHHLTRRTQLVKYRLLHHPTVTQVLDDDPLKQRRRHAGVPDAFRIHHDDRPSGANAETWRLAALYAARTEEQSFTLQQACELRVKRATAPIGRAEAAHAHEHVARVGLHERCWW